MFLGRITMLLLITGSYGCQPSPSCRVDWSQPNIISMGSKQLLKRTVRTLENNFYPSHFAESLSVKSCRLAYRSGLYICNAEIANVDVKWVGSLTPYLLIVLLSFFNRLTCNQLNECERFRSHLSLN